MNNTRPLAHSRHQPVASDMRQSRLTAHPITRAMFAAYVAKTGRAAGASSDDILKKIWPGDATAAQINRAAIGIGDATEHAAVVQQSVASFFASVPLSAGARLIEMAAQIPLEGGSALLPHVPTAQPVAPWVGEGLPIPVQSTTFAAAELGPFHKAATILTATRELARRAGAEAIFALLLQEQAALTLDAALFNADAADDDRPAGLLHGVTPIDSAQYGPVEVLAALAGALGAAGGSGQVAIVTTPTIAMTLQLHLPMLRWPVLPSLVISAGTIVALDPTALAFASGAQIDIEAAQAATLHMSDDPAEIVSATGPTTADPVRSLWQTDAIAVRLIAEIAFVMRAPGRVQIAAGVHSW